MKELTVLEAMELLYTSKKKDRKAMVKFSDVPNVPEVELVGVCFESTRPFLFLTILYGKQERITGNRCYSLK